MDNIIQFPRRLQLVANNDDIAVNLQRLAEVLEFIEKPENTFMMLFILEDLYEYFKDQKTIEGHFIAQNLNSAINLMRQSHQS